MAVSHQLRILHRSHLAALADKKGVAAGSDIGVGHFDEIHTAAAERTLLVVIGRTDRVELEPTLPRVGAHKMGAGLRVAAYAFLHGEVLHTVGTLAATVDEGEV